MKNTKILILSIALGLLILSSCLKHHSASDVVNNIVVPENEEVHFYAKRSDGGLLQFDLHSAKISTTFVTKSNNRNCQPPIINEASFQLTSKSDSSSYIYMGAYDLSNFGVSAYQLMVGGMPSIVCNLKKNGINYYEVFQIVNFKETYNKIINNNRIHKKGNATLISFDSNSNVKDSMLLSNMDFVYFFRE